MVTIKQLISSTVNVDADFRSTLLCSVLFFSRPRSEGWPHHGRTFSIYLCPLSFWLTLPRGVLSTYWCSPSRPCVHGLLACVHVALFLALSLSPDNFLLSSWYKHSMLAFALTVSNSTIITPALLRTHSFAFFAVPQNPQSLSQPFYLKGAKTCFFILSKCPAFTAVRRYRPQ